MVKKHTIESHFFVKYDITRCFAIFASMVCQIFLALSCSHLEEAIRVILSPHRYVQLQGLRLHFVHV